LASSNPNSEEPQCNHGTPHRVEQLGAPLAAETEDRRHDLGVFQSEEAGQNGQAESIRMLDRCIRSIRICALEISNSFGIIEANRRINGIEYGNWNFKKIFPPPPFSQTTL